MTGNDSDDAPLKKPLFEHCPAVLGQPDEHCAIHPALMGYANNRAAENEEV